MMENLWAELARNIPSAAAVIFTVYIMSYFDEKREVRREANAKEKSKEDREHEIAMQAMWRDSFNLMNNKTDETFKLIAEMVDNHEKASTERYNKIGVTQDLIRLAKEKKG